MMRPFPPCQQRRRAEERRQATTFEKAHGRRERRTLTATTALNEHLNWPGAGQVFQVVRERTHHGTTTREVAYGITSLSPREAGAERLLALNRETNRRKCSNEFPPLIPPLMRERCNQGTRGRRVVQKKTPGNPGVF